MLSIKQKQVLGVTSIVVLVVVILSALQLVSLTGILLKQSRQRGELIAMTIYHRSQEVVKSEETAYQDLRRDPGVRASLEAALYSEDVVYAAIVDGGGTVVAHSDPSRVGERLPNGDDLAALTEANGLTQLRSVYQTDRMLEWRRPLLLGDTPFAEMRVGFSTLLIRQSPQALAAVCVSNLAHGDCDCRAPRAGRRAADSRHQERAVPSRARRPRRHARPQRRRVQGARRRFCQRDQAVEGGDSRQRQAR